MKSLADTFFGKSLGLLADVVIRYRWLFLWPQILLCGLCILYTVHYLQFDPSRDNLVGSGKKYHQTYLKFKQEFPEQDDLVVVVESDDQEKNRQFVERLGAKVDVETNTFTNVIYRTDFKMLGHKALLFASADDLKGLRGQLKSLPAVHPEIHPDYEPRRAFRNGERPVRRRNETNAQNNALIKAIPVLATNRQSGR